MMCHNPYFNRWFSAILRWAVAQFDYKSHNPYFNRWFSAIKIQKIVLKWIRLSQSLF